MKQFNSFFKMVCILGLLWGSNITMAWAAQAHIGLDAIVAIVNDQTITNSQLTAQIKLAQQEMEANHIPVPSYPILKKKVLEQMIDKELQLQLAKKKGLKIDDANINQAIVRIAEQNGVSKDILMAKVRQQGMSESQYRKEIQNEIIISQVQQRAVAPRIEITDQEVTDFLQLHEKEIIAAQNQQRNADYHLVALLIPIPDSPTEQQISDSKKAAQDVVAQLRSGADIQQLPASQLGIQYNIQLNDLGWRKLTQFPDVYIPSLQTLQPESVAGPLRAGNGFHVIKLLAIKGGVTPLQKGTADTHVRHILIKSSPTATDSQLKARLDILRASILGGTPFEKIAETNSQDPISASEGGDLGWVKPNTLDPAFEQVMNQMKPGQISVPFKSQFGWHILQVLGRKTHTNKQDSLRDQAKMLIFQHKFTIELKNWLESLRGSQYVKVFD